MGDLREPRPGERIRAEWAAAVVRLLKQVVSGPDVVVTPTGIHIRRPPRDRPPFWAKITASTADGTNRWKYSWVEVYKSAAGYAGWSTLTGGRSGTTNARNSIEDMNSGTDVQGNGVDVANLLGTFALQPCPANCIVRMHQVGFGSTTEYWFSYANGVDGECD
jgi:hypothetical protein